MDISPTALRRARQHAQSQGGDAAGIEWVEADLMVWEPPGKHFDLVTALYVHPAGSRQQLIRRLAAAVAPGGTLFAVEHGHSDEHARTHASADQLAAALDPREWEIEAGETRERRDVVLCARRRP